MNLGGANRITDRRAVVIQPAVYSFSLLYYERGSRIATALRNSAAAIPLNHGNPLRSAVAGIAPVLAGQ
jgi:hypothetical protein